MQCGEILVAQRAEELGVVALAGGIEPGGTRQRPVDADVPEIEVQSADPRANERRQQQLHHFAVGGDAGVPVQLAADLHHLAGIAGSGGRGMQHAPRVAEARDAGFVEQVGIDARDLRRGVRPQPQHPAGKRIDHLERLQVEVAPGAGQQRVEVLDQRRRHQAIAVRVEMIEQRAAQRLDPCCLGGQHVLDRLGQQPFTHSG